MKHINDITLEDFWDAPLFLLEDGERVLVEGYDDENQLHYAGYDKKGSFFTILAQKARVKEYCAIPDQAVKIKFRGGHVLELTNHDEHGRRFQIDVESEKEKFMQEKKIGKYASLTEDLKKGK